MNKDKIDAFLRIGSWVTLAAFAVIFFYRPVEIEDVWWHLSVGRWMSTFGAFPTRDVFSISATPAPWILTQAPGSCLLYALFLLGDVAALKAFRVIIFLAAFMIFFRQANKHIPAAFLMILLLTMCLGLDTRANLRPYLFNLIFIQLFLILLLNHDETVAKKIFLIPLLSAAWINLHLGAFVYGSSLLGIFLFSYMVEYANQKMQNNLSQLAVCRQKIKDITLATAGYFASFLMNPYGWEGAAYPFKAIFDRDFIIRKLLTGSVIELMPPQYIFSWAGAWIFFVVAATLAALASNKRRTFAHVLLFVCSFFMFLYTKRAATFFLLCSAYVILESAKQAGLNIYWQKKASRAAWERAFYIVLTAFLLLNVARFINKKAFIDGKFTPEIGLALSPYTPVNALTFLKHHGLQGRVLNWDGYGGYIMWKGFPQLKAFVDGRQANEEFYADYLRLLTNPRKYAPSLMEKYNFDLALLDGNFGTTNALMEYLFQNPDWRLVYLKGASVIFVHRKSHSVPEDLLNVETALRNQPSLSATELSRIENSRSKGKGFINFVNPQADFIEPLEEGSILFKLGLRSAAYRKLYEAYTLTGSEKALRLLTLALQEERQLRLQ